METAEKHYRMYCLAERHLSSIQKAIQSAHAVVEYSLKYGDTYSSYWLRAYPGENLKPTIFCVLVFML